MQNNSIWGDLRQKLAVVREMRQNGRPTTEAEIQEASEAKAWLIISGVTLFLAAFVGFMSYKYYRFAFDVSFPGASWWMATGAALLHEVVKISLMYAALSALFFGWMFKTWSKFFGNSISLALAIGCYVWSYQISTKGVALYAKETATATEAAAHATLPQAIAEATAGVDAQLAAINGQNATAAEMKTKRGKINWAGQSTIMQNSAAAADLQKQRSQIVNETTRAWGKQADRSEVKVNVLAQWVQDFGGYGEWALLLCIVGLIFYDRNANTPKAAPQSEPTTTAPAPQSEPATTATAASPTPAASRPVAPASPFVQFERQGTPGTPHNGQPYPQNSAPRKIGYDYGQNTTPHTPQSLPHSATGVAEIQTMADPDAILALSRSNILKIWKNNEDPHARNATVAGRLTGYVHDATRHFSKPDFLPLDAKGWGSWVEAFVAMYNRWNPLEPDVFTDQYFRQIHGLIEQVNARRDQVARTQYSLFPEPEPTTAP